MQQPHIEQRPAQSYVAIPVTVRMPDFAAAIDRGFPELFGWMAARSLVPAGAPFIRYLRVDMDGELAVELAAPVDGATPADERVRGDELPAGHYVTLLHVGPYDGLLQANAALQQWAGEHGLRWAMDGSNWRGRVEHYLTDPAQEPNASRWQTEVAYLLSADSAVRAPAARGTSAFRDADH
jgi:effector-binding domain-containing protein